MNITHKAALLARYHAAVKYGVPPAEAVAVLADRHDLSEAEMTELVAVEQEVAA